MIARIRRRKGRRLTNWINFADQTRPVKRLGKLKFEKVNVSNIMLSILMVVYRRRNGPSSIFLFRYKFHTAAIRLSGLDDENNAFPV